MEERELNVTWCYPDILNLHGDRGNLWALKRIGNMMGVTVNVKKVESYSERIDWENTDILFFNPGELKVCPTIVEALSKQKYYIGDYVNKNKMIIAIGTAGAILGKAVRRVAGDSFEGLGILDMYCEEREYVFGDDLIFKLPNEMEINGSQISLFDTYLDSTEPLGEVLYVHGNNGKDKKEGAKQKNVYWTNCLGPVFIKNPWWTEELIRQAMKTKRIEIDEYIDPNKFAIELKSLDCIKKYNNEKEKI